MNEAQKLWWEQAKSDHAVFDYLRGLPWIHECHALHYLQMATELLGKANAWKVGPIGKKSHKALVSFLRSLASNRKAQKQLGYEGQNEHWAHTIRKITPLAESLQKLAPALANDGPNPEYPWPTDSPTAAPAEYTFPIWEELSKTSYGRTLISLVHHLFAGAEEYM